MNIIKCGKLMENKYIISRVTIAFFSNFLLSFTLGAQGSIIEGFPEGCTDASTRDPLPGHIIRLGRVARDGMSFYFLDQNDSQNLQSVSIADNAGLIGQSPEQGSVELVRQETPPNSFAVAQILVGDQDMEPMATCLSMAMPLEQYVPDDYGPEWTWLPRTLLITRLRIDHYFRWDRTNWKRWWRNDFERTRGKWREWRKDLGARKGAIKKPEERIDRGREIRKKTEGFNNGGKRMGRQRTETGFERGREVKERAKEGRSSPNTMSRNKTIKSRNEEARQGKQRHGRLPR
jgi:hypothetical protein